MASGLVLFFFLKEIRRGTPKAAGQGPWRLGFLARRLLGPAPGEEGIFFKVPVLRHLPGSLESHPESLEPDQF